MTLIEVIIPSSTPRDFWYRGIPNFLMYITNPRLSKDPHHFTRWRVSLFSSTTFPIPSLIYALSHDVLVFVFSYSRTVPCAGITSGVYGSVSLHPGLLRAPNISLGNIRNTIWTVVSNRSKVLCVVLVSDAKSKNNKTPTLTLLPL